MSLQTLWLIVESNLIKTHSYLQCSRDQSFARDVLCFKWLLRRLLVHNGKFDSLTVCNEIVLRYRLWFAEIGPYNGLCGLGAQTKGITGFFLPYMIMFRQKMYIFSLSGLWFGLQIFFLDIWWLKSPVVCKNPISNHIFIPNSKRVKFPTSVHSEDMKTNSTIHIVIFADEYYRSQNHLQIDTMKCYCNKKRLQLHIFGLNNTAECYHSIKFHRRHCLLAEIMRTRVYSI